MRALIQGLDRLLRCIYDVYEFCAAPNCLFRLRMSRAPHVLPLPDGEVGAGAPVVELHLWNEHIPRIPDEGPDIAWARRVHRMLIDSFQAVAVHIRHDPRLLNAQAVGGVTVLLTVGDPSGGKSLMRRLGFTVLPYHTPLGRFGEFWENFYTWMLIWTFNTASLRQRRLLRLRRSEVWMSAEEFLRRYERASGVKHSERVLTADCEAS
ncbi:MAG TPA: hypothetical protein VFL17_22375 [Anaerolineae bacterium]|nr:hypothetical protein [Anaerolineae bacterium]